MSTAISKNLNKTSEKFLSIGNLRIYPIRSLTTNQYLNIGLFDMDSIGDDIESEYKYPIDF